jgi:hypothetical protein
VGFSCKGFAFNVLSFWNKENKINRKTLLRYSQHIMPKKFTGRSGLGAARNWPS